MGCRMRVVFLAASLLFGCIENSRPSPLEIEPEFCPSENLVGVECRTSQEGGTAPIVSSSIDSTVALLRCYSGCLANEELAIDKSNIDFSQPWPFVDPETLPPADLELLTTCRFRCPVMLLAPLPLILCTGNCPMVSGPNACVIGCEIGLRLRENLNSGQGPATPSDTPSIFFDPMSTQPWIISLSLSSISPVIHSTSVNGSTPMPTNGSSPMNGSKSVVGFALEFIIPDGDTNLTFHYPMFHPEQPGTILLSNFLSYYRCSVAYYTVAIVNEFGFAPLTPHVRSCIPGVYELTVEPGRSWAPQNFILEGDDDTPDLGRIFFNWGRPPQDNLFDLTKFEVRGGYSKSNTSLDNVCLGNKSGSPIVLEFPNTTETFSIPSGDHGLIKLISPDVFCVYQVDITSVWHTDDIISFLREFRRTISFRIEVIFRSPNLPSLVIGRSLTPLSDGNYKLTDLYGCLNPQDNKFLEAFNLVNWSIFKLVQNNTGAPGPNAVSRYLVNESKGVVTSGVMRQDNPCTSSKDLVVLLPPMSVLDAGLFEQLDHDREPGSLYQIEVTPIRSRLVSPPAARGYLDLTQRAFSMINPSDIPPVPPGAVQNLSIDSCIVRFSVETNLTVSWEPPSFIFGSLKSCSLTIMGQQSTLQPTQRVVNISLDMDLVQQGNNITAQMDCTNSYGETGTSSQVTYNMDLCAIMDIPMITSSAVMSSSISLSASGGMEVSTTSVTVSSSPTPPVQSPVPPGQQVDNFYIAIGAGGGLIVAIILVFLAIICFFCCRRKRFPEKSEFWELRRTRSILRKNAGLPTTGDDWEVDPNHLYMNNKLGEGNFGEVYKATLSPGLTSPRAKKYADTVKLLSKSQSPCYVAVKVLKTNAPSDTKQSFLNEIKMMKSVASGTNIHVVKMVGCVTIQEPLALILEFIPYGNLLDYLRTNRKLAQKRRQHKLRHRQKLSVEHGRYVAGILTPIEEASLHSMDSAPYLRDSEINERRNSQDSYFSHLTPQDTPHLSVSPPRDLKEQNGSSKLDADQLLRASPYMEPVDFLPNDRNMGHNRPASYIQPIVSPLFKQDEEELVEAGGKLKEEDGEKKSGKEETRKESGSSASNPLYDDPEFKNPYPDLGELEAFNLMMFAYQIASGMEYLASLGIVHRDLACRNVLVDRDKILKISDFGLSRETDMYVSSTQGKLPLRWMSPEAILDRVFTEKSDVWAYGITIWEICTLGGYPYATIPNKAVLHSLLGGYRLEKPHNCSEEIHKIMSQCWEMDPENRPDFQHLREHMDNLMEHHQADKYIKFSDIDDDKLPYYKAGVFSGSGSGSGDDNPFESGNGSITQQVTLEPVHPGSDSSQLLIPKSRQNGNENITKGIPISPQSSGGTIKDESVIDDDSKDKNKGDLSAENSEISLSAQDSACTIKDDVSSEESKL